MDQCEKKRKKIKNKKIDGTIRLELIMNRDAVLLRPLKYDTMKDHVIGPLVVDDKIGSRYYYHDQCYSGVV